MDNQKNKIIYIALGVLIFFSCLIPVLWILITGPGSSLFDFSNSGLANLSKPTPFQPYRYTATPERLREPIANTLVPNDGFIPPEGQINFLILGSDWRPDGGFRTDVILLVSMYTLEGKISLLSFPRDLWVEIPGYEQNRINTAMGRGGFPLFAETFERNFAIPVDYYMMTNFNGFKSIIDALGGIEIETPQNTADSCTISYLQTKWCSVGPGTVKLDGELALWYVRSRYTSSDFDRTRRAQEVMEGFFKKLMSINAVSRAPEIYSLFISSVETDLQLNDILQLIRLAPAILTDPSRVRRYAIGINEAVPNITDGGASVLMPDYSAIWQIVREAVYTP